MNALEGIEFAMGVEELEKDLPTLKRYYKAASEAMFSYFDSLCTSGFTIDQALEIVIAHGFSPENSSVGKHDGPYRMEDEGDEQV